MDPAAMDPAASRMWGASTISEGAVTMQEEGAGRGGGQMYVGWGARREGAGCRVQGGGGASANGWHTVVHHD